MPGAFNPVSSTPQSGMPQSKSLRTRLGFGGSSGGGAGPSMKASFFSFKPGRKSFGGPGDFRANDRPVLVIDPQPEHESTWHENRVVLNEETEPIRPLQSPVKSSTHSSPTKDSHFSRPRHIASHSLPASPVDTHSPLRPFNSHMGAESSIHRAALESQFGPDESGISKHFPDLSTDLSLLMNEPPPDTASQSDLHESQASGSQAGRSNSGSFRGGAGAQAPLLGSSPAALENYDQTQRWNLQELASAVHQIRSIASLPPDAPQGGPEASESAVSGFTSSAVENASASFDLSSAKLSLDLMRKSIGEEWARTLVIEGSGAPSADTSGLLGPPESSVLASGSGPVTSTPFLSPCTSPTQLQGPEPEMSFDLEALDPDLVALLRPNNYNHAHPQMNRIVTPSPLEPFAPPPDPLNPGTTMERPSTSPPASSSEHRVRRQAEGLAPSPVRKYATLSASTSPTRPSRLPRSYTAQDIVSPSRTSNPSKTDNHSELPLLPTYGHDDGRPSPSSGLTSSSDADTPSDMSKQPSPLSAPPLTLGDLERTREPSPAQSSSASTSTSNNITARRKARTAAPAQIQSPRPGSVLTSSTDSRPTPRYVPRNRERELKPASASASPNSPGPSTHNFGSAGREREHIRPSIEGLFPARFSPEGSAGRPRSAGGGRASNAFNAGPSLNGVLPQTREREWEMPAERRYRKRSMSLDQSGGFERRGEDPHRQGAVSPRFRGPVDRDRLAESVGYGGSEVAYGARGGLAAPYDGRDPDRDRDRERYGYGYGYGDRERYGRPHTDWLGPRTAKAFAAAGLLDEPRDAAGSRYGGFSRSTSERDFRTPGIGSGRERVSPGSGGFQSGDGERERGHFRYNFTSSARRDSDREFRTSGVRAGAESPSTASGTRPPSRGESWSHSRPAPVFVRTMSDLMSHRGSVDGRDSVSAIHPRTDSAYSAGGGAGGGSTGSGGGRASPTTTSSLAAVQSHVQALKDKHGAQTEALLAALADSQRVSRELREENDALKGQVRALEERLVDAITSSRQKDKEFARAMRTRPPHTPDRTRTVAMTVPLHRDSDFPHLPRPPTLSKRPARSTPSPTKRRLSTSSSVFPIIPGSMSLLMAETPGSPPQGSLGSGSSPPSPTLVLPRLAPQKSPERRDINGHSAMTLPAPQPIPISHKRSTSGASMATSANFSFETGSPGSLKLKPEHELLLGDMTRLSLVTGFGGDSESEG